MCIYIYIYIFFFTELMKLLSESTYLNMEGFLLFIAVTNALCLLGCRCVHAGVRVSAHVYARVCVCVRSRVCVCVCVSFPALTTANCSIYIFYAC